MPPLESLLDRLVAHNVEFVVVGGFAAVAHGSTLVTQDIDVCISLTRENLFRLQRALAGLNPVHRLTPQRLPLDIGAADVEGLRNLYLDTDHGPLDCLGEVLGVGDYTAVRAQSVEVPVAAGRCRILSLEALIRSKEAMGRPQDKLAVLQLKAIQQRLRGGW